jgi:hypothetical protein
MPRYVRYQPILWHIVIVVILICSRTKVTITKLVDGSPLEDARLSDLYIPCAEAGLVGSGDGFIQY